MANYQETTVAGTSYVRCNKVEIENKDLFKMITFYEEEVFNLDNNKIVRRNVAKIAEQLTADNALTSFPVLDPDTNAETGTSLTYQEVYGILYSLYLHMAFKRDAEQQPA